MAFGQSEDEQRRLRELQVFAPYQPLEGLGFKTKQGLLSGFQWNSINEPELTLDVDGIRAYGLDSIYQIEYLAKASTIEPNRVISTSFDTITLPYTPLSIITGPTGPIGDPGTAATGLQGPVGEQGPTGIAGADGGEGAPGRPGATGSTGIQGFRGPRGVEGECCVCKTCAPAADGSYTTCETGCKLPFYINCSFELPNAIFHYDVTEDDAVGSLDGPGCFDDEGNFSDVGCSLALEPLAGNQIDVSLQWNVAAGRYDVVASNDLSGTQDTCLGSAGDCNNTRPAGTQTNCGILIGKTGITSCQNCTLTRLPDTITSPHIVINHGMGTSGAKTCDCGWSEDGQELNICGHGGGCTVITFKTPTIVCDSNEEINGEPNPEYNKMYVHLEIDETKTRIPYKGVAEGLKSCQLPAGCAFLQGQDVVYDDACKTCYENDAAAGDCVGCLGRYKAPKNSKLFYNVACPNTFVNFGTCGNCLAGCLFDLYDDNPCDVCQFVNEIENSVAGVECNVTVADEPSADFSCNAPKFESMGGYICGQTASGSSCQTGCFPGVISNGCVNNLSHLPNDITSTCAHNMGANGNTNCHCFGDTFEYGTRPNGATITCIGSQNKTATKCMDQARITGCDCECVMISTGQGQGNVNIKNRILVSTCGGDFMSQVTDTGAFKELASTGFGTTAGTDGDTQLATLIFDDDIGGTYT
tara:strand:+ start:13795 stop:15888 length:2094 start_codon:yes stop_codon:yes gene_type:complete